MPELHGHQVFHEMRREGWRIPVISESAFDEKSLLELDGGEQMAHLVCPYEPIELEEAIRKGLRAAGSCLPPKGVVVFETSILTWNEGTITRLAHFISEERAFDCRSRLATAVISPKWGKLGCGGAVNTAYR